MLSEHEEQCLFVEWFELNYKCVRFYAIPNGGHRYISVAKKLKKEGVKPGVPDIHIPAWKLWIEFKSVKGGTLSREQKAWRDYLMEIGDNWILAKGFESAVEQVVKFKMEQGI